MISFRTHVVSLVAVLLALAAGVALGGGPLSDASRGTLSSATTDSPPAAPGPADDFGDRFAVDSAARLYAGGLATHPVAVLTLPGADKAVVDALVGQVEAAGGDVSGTFPATRGLVGTGDTSLVDTLGSQLAQQLDGGTVDADAPTYVRMGQLIARAIASGQPEGAAQDPKGASVRQSLTGANLLGGPKELARRAPLVLVVTGDDVDDDILSGLVEGLASRAVGVVAAGATEHGDVAALRTNAAAADVATVDGVETDLGRVATTLALIRSLSETGGAFGASGSDGAVPLR